MAENSPDQTSLTPATAENREADFHSADPTTAEFWEKHGLDFSTRMQNNIGRTMGEDWTQEDPNG